MPNMPKTDVPSPIDTLDLRQLRFLLSLLRCGSITQAGESTGLSQPAASRTVARLRQQLGDPLLVRKRNGFVLTAQAQALEAPLQQALGLLDVALAPDTFVPALARRVFRLASTDYGVSSVAHRCLQGLAGTAPDVTLRFDPWSADTLLRLEQDQLDFALYADAALPGDFHYRNLFREHYVLLGPSTHPAWDEIGSDPIRLPELVIASAYPHFAVRYPKGSAHETDDAYRRLGLRSPTIRFEVPYFNLSAQALAEGGLLALLPSRVVTQLVTHHPLKALKVDIGTMSFDYRLIWHTRNHRDPGCVWLRQFISQACE